MDQGRVCSSDGCDKKLNAANKTGRCSKHFYVPKNKRGPRATVAAPKPKAKSAPARAKAGRLIDAPRALVGVATLSVSEIQIDRMFLAWSLQDEVACVQAFLDREN